MTIINKKDHILNVAEELFAEMGYDGTSVRMIASKAKVNIAMISYYFGSKELLLMEMVEKRASVFRERLQKIQKDSNDPVQQIESVIDSYVDKVFANYRFHKILHRQISLQSTGEMSVRIQDILLRNIDEIRNIIINGIEKKIFRQVDVEGLILTFFGTVTQLANSSCLSLRMFSLDPSEHISEYPELKVRMKSYLTDLFKKYLLASHD